MSRRPWRRAAAAAAALGALAGAVLSAATLAAAAVPPPAWTPLGPLATGPHRAPAAWSVVAVPGQPQRLLVATSQGVLESTDGGATWAPTPLRGLVWALAFGPHGHTLYAGTARQGVQRSRDLGQTWQADNTGLGNLDVRAIAVAPTAIVLGTDAGVYVSGTGTGWAAEGLATQQVSSVAVITPSPLAVLAGADGGMLAGGALFRNLAVTSGGGWQPLSQGDPGNVPVWAVAAGPLALGRHASPNPPLLEGNAKGLFLSTTDGQTWAQLTLAAGVLWTPTAIAFDPRNPAVAYVGGDNGGSSGGGLQRTTDGGASWTPVQAGLPSPNAVSLTALATQPLTVLATVVDPNTMAGGVARLVDASVPGPVAVAAASGPPVTVTVVPVTPGPTHRRPPRRARPPSLLRGMPAWVPVVAGAALILVLFGTGLGLRRRRERLEVEGPP